MALLVIAAGLATPAGAQQTPQQCAAIAADSDRLACYDALFGGAPAAGGDGAVVIESEQLIPALPSGRQRATMTVACADGQVGVGLQFAGQLVSSTGDIAPVTYQVDSNATFVRTMRANEANTELTFDTARDTATFLDGLAGGTSVKIRMTPVRQRSLTVSFRIAGVVDEIEALRSACGT